MSYVFFPGCSLDGTARDFHRSTLAVAAKLGLDLPELADWTCCGSTAAHSTDPLLAFALPAKNLSAADGHTVAVACAACYSRLKMANHHISGDSAVRAKVAQVVGSDYDGRTPVRHLLEILCRDIGRSRIAAAIRRPLTGLKVACYYGCLLARPPEVTNFDDAENPTLMDQLLETAGATAIDWPHKTECCGAGYSITDVSIVLKLSSEILSMAKVAGADCIATACPLCQLNLDLRQKDIEARFGRRYNLPVFYFTQLLGLAMGCTAGEVSLGSLVVEPRAVLESKGIGGAEARL
ncbi:MAG: CoB--CoM heterodisulfide reductase iron-sulfur subunit B family protein [Bryobacteraceae bacterium]